MERICTSSDVSRGATTCRQSKTIFPPSKGIPACSYIAPNRSPGDPLWKGLCPLVFPVAVGLCRHAGSQRASPDMADTKMGFPFFFFSFWVVS